MFASRPPALQLRDSYSVLNDASLGTKETDKKHGLISVMASSEDGPEQGGRVQRASNAPQLTSRFESAIFGNAPIVESFLRNTPTLTIFNLYHVSRYVRNYLRNYPLAWQHLSFRIAQPANTTVTPPNSDQKQSKNYALDHLILEVISPFSSCIKSLEVDNTAVSGRTLTDTVLTFRKGTIEHLSIRGCKNVSLKYHIIPYLAVIRLEQNREPNASQGGLRPPNLALKSLYTYRCRHHRRRPYLPASLHRRDSDSEPTHELVELCHNLRIYTDTAWCTTPGGRCFRRRGYVQMRVPHGTAEVWVVFDRLWRSKNWIGPSTRGEPFKERDGRSWENREHGFEGEALGIEGSRHYSEGKTLPTHLRHSHREFVDNIKCDSCGEKILERCEQCSVMMHCAGCRKTLCHSCAFDRPFPSDWMVPLPEAGHTKEPDKFWWAPGFGVSPCRMSETAPQPQPPQPPQQNQNNATPSYPNLKFKWCCWEPLFSGGGGISYGGPQTPTRDHDRMRAVPLPKGRGWEDPDFDTPLLERKQNLACGPLPDLKKAFEKSSQSDLMKWLLGGPETSSVVSPRNLCQECYDSDVWKMACKSCSRVLCMEHDLRGLRARICGCKPLSVEKAAINQRTEERRKEEARITQDADDDVSPDTPTRSLSPLTATPSSGTECGDPSTPTRTHVVDEGSVSSEMSESLMLAQPTPIRPGPSFTVSDTIQRPVSSCSDRTAQAENDDGSRCSTPDFSPDQPSDAQQQENTTKPEPWTGCLSFFCPSVRPMGDHRVLCGPYIRECISCKTLVCESCLKAESARRYEANMRDLTTVEADYEREEARSKGCDCAACGSRFFCPNCRRDREQKGECKFVEEERQRLQERFQKEIERQQQIREREDADRIAEGMCEFWGSLQDLASSASLADSPLQPSLVSGKERLDPSSAVGAYARASKLMAQQIGMVEQSKRVLKDGMTLLAPHDASKAKRKVIDVLKTFLEELDLAAGEEAKDDGNVVKSRLITDTATATAGPSSGSRSNDPAWDKFGHDRETGASNWKNRRVLVEDSESLEALLSHTTRKGKEIARPGQNIQRMDSPLLWARRTSSILTRGPTSLHSALPPRTGLFLSDMGFRPAVDDEES